jgi:hypothetical protein
MPTGAISVPGMADVRLTDTELQLVRDRIASDSSLTATSAALAEASAGTDVRLPDAELGAFCHQLNELTMSLSARQMSSLTGLMELRAVVC